MLPGNQHGFRSNKSTLIAWADIQEDSATNTENKQSTNGMTDSKQEIMQASKNERQASKHANKQASPAS